MCGRLQNTIRTLALVDLRNRPKSLPVRAQLHQYPRKGYPRITSKVLWQQPERDVS